MHAKSAAAHKGKKVALGTYRWSLSILKLLSNDDLYPTCFVDLLQSKKVKLGGIIITKLFSKLLTLTCVYSLTNASNSLRINTDMWGKNCQMFPDGSCSNHVPVSSLGLRVDTKNASNGEPRCIMTLPDKGKLSSGKERKWGTRQKKMKYPSKLKSFLFVHQCVRYTARIRYLGPLCIFGGKPDLGTGDKLIHNCMPQTALTPLCTAVCLPYIRRTVCRAPNSSGVRKTKR